MKRKNKGCFLRIFITSGSKVLGFCPRDIMPINSPKADEKLRILLGGTGAPNLTLPQIGFDP